MMLYSQVQILIFKTRFGRDMVDNSHCSDIKHVFILFVYRAVPDGPITILNFFLAVSHQVDVPLTRLYNSSKLILFVQQQRQLYHLQNFSNTTFLLFCINQVRKGLQLVIVKRQLG